MIFFSKIIFKIICFFIIMIVVTKKNFFSSECMKQSGKCSSSSKSSGSGFAISTSFSTSKNAMNGQYENGSIKRNGQYNTSSSNNGGTNVHFNGQGNIESGNYNSVKVNGTVVIGDKNDSKIHDLKTNGNVDIFNAHIGVFTSNGNTLISKCVITDGKSSGKTIIDESQINSIIIGETIISNSKIRELIISVPTSSSWLSWSNDKKKPITIRIINSKIDKITYKKEDKTYIKFDIDEKSSVKFTNEI